MVLTRIGKKFILAATRRRIYSSDDILKFRFFFHFDHGVKRERADKTL